MYVLDTNTIVYYFKGMGKVAEHLMRVAPADIGIPSIVLYELEVGIGKSASPAKRIDQLAALAAGVTVLPFGGNEARQAAKIRVALEKRGVPIGPYDVLIAATALANRAVLVTRNRAEFGRIKQLQVEDWFV